MVKVLTKDIETLPAIASKECAFVNIELFNHDCQTFEVTIRLFAISYWGTESPLSSYNSILKLDGCRRTSTWLFDLCQTCENSVEITRK